MASPTLSEKGAVFSTVPTPSSPLRTIPEGDDDDDDIRRDPMADEKARLSQTEQRDSESGQPLPAPKNRMMLAFWTVTNVVSTVAIVFINKQIFSSPAFNSAQFIFAAYHFLLVSLILSLLSSPSSLLASLKQFDRRHVSVRTIAPFAASMALNVVFLNTSLAFCTVLFYQIVRVLLSPVVAAIEYFFYGKSIPRQAAWCLLPTCLGVAWLAASDAKQPKDGSTQTTSAFGAGFALTGVVISSVYTVWIRTYQAKLEMSGTQLLHAQSPVGAVMLVVVGVASGKIPHFADFDATMWYSVLLSGLCACLINLSQFNFVGSAGSVAGTIIGHVKSIIIVLLGYALSGKSISDGSALGIGVAIAGIAAYTWASLKYSKA